MGWWRQNITAEGECQSGAAYLMAALKQMEQGRAHPAGFFLAFLLQQAPSLLDSAIHV